MLLAQSSSPERPAESGALPEVSNLDRECSFSSPERVLAIGAIGGVHDGHRNTLCEAAGSDAQAMVCALSRGQQRRACLR